MFCSGGSDGLAVLYDGKTSEKKAMLGGDKAHSGGIYAVSFYGNCGVYFSLL